MPTLYRRQIRTSVAGLTIEGLRQSLSIERHIDPTQNRGSIAIYNLSVASSNRMIPTTATGAIRERGIPIRIEAGYPDTQAVVFDGEVQRAIRSREDVNVITRVTLGDMVRNVTRLGGVTNRTYPGIANVRQIASDLVSDMGLEPGPLDAIPEFAFVIDFSFTGISGAALRAVLDGASPSLPHVQWFEVDGVVRFNTPGIAQADAPTIELSPDTGLIESPVPTDEGAEARSFLNPAIVPGCLIDLRSASLSGLWKVVALRHTGDNWSGEFETAVDMRRQGEGVIRVSPVPPPPPGTPTRAGVSGRGGGTGPIGGGGTGRAIPNGLSIVRRVAAENPAALANSCQRQGGSWEFMDLVVAALRETDPRWGYNLKRGGPDLSEDAIAYYRGDGAADGSNDVAIIDIIGGHCGPNPQPAWLDQTAATARAGSVGAWKYPR